MFDTNIQVKLDHFDGPLALLLHLIQEEEMNIKDLDLKKITKEYLDFLSKMKELNFDLAGDYLYLAATLILLKSKNAVELEEGNLKKEELEALGASGIKSKADLIKRLEELEHFQKLGRKFWDSTLKKGTDVFCRPRIDRRAIINSILTPMDLQVLTGTMIDLIRKEKRKFTMVKRDRLSIKEKLKTLKENLKSGEKKEFYSLLGEDRHIDNIVITFISLLELARLKKLRIYQNEESLIYIDVDGDLTDFDVEMANGFDDPNAPAPEDNEENSDDVKEEKAFVGEIQDELIASDDSENNILQ